VKDIIENFVELLDIENYNEEFIKEELDELDLPNDINNIIVNEYLNYDDVSKFIHYIKKLKCINFNYEEVGYTVDYYWRFELNEIKIKVDNSGDVSNLFKRISFNNLDVSLEESNRHVISKLYDLDINFELYVKLFEIFIKTINEYCDHYYHN
jgi:hypothetical protein